MNTLSHLLRRVWHSIPEVARSAVGKIPGVSRVRDRVARFAYSHDEKYHQNYYEEIDAYAMRSFSAISASIVEKFSPKSVIDVGCGTGALLYYLKQQGVDGFGLEYSEAGLRKCLERGVSVRKYDIINDDLSDLGIYDIAVSMEVGEHLPRRVARRYVELLCKLAPVVVFSAARPGQLGVDHINLQPRKYWIELFKQYGLVPDCEQTKRWEKDWKAAEIAAFYYENLIVFRSENSC